MDESSKSSSCNGSQECKEQVGDHLISNKEALEIPAKNDDRVKRFNKYGRYPKRKWRPLGEWWNNHILPQHGKKNQCGIFGRFLEFVRSVEIRRCEQVEAAIQEKYALLMANGT